MDTEKAIKLVNCHFAKLLSADECKSIKIILKRGEKFEKIENAIKQYCLISENQNMLKEVIRLEQKYFPPKCPANFTKKVMKKIEEGGEKSGNGYKKKTIK